MYAHNLRSDLWRNSEFRNAEELGDKKLQDISTLLSKLIIVDVNSGDPDMLKAYAEIDAFSKGRLPGHPLGTSAITMGKNDLWIAATAKVANATLITVDSDFNHLNNNFIRVKKY